MGNKKWTEVYFSKRLKHERERREWTQAEMAKLLSDKLNASIHWTTIAKIEKGERSVRIDEAAGIADLFGTSVDALLGRKSPGLDSDLAHTVRVLQETAQKSMLDVGAMLVAVRDRFQDLFELEFDGRERLESEGKRAVESLTEAQEALWHISSFELPPESIVRVRDDLVKEAAQRELIRMLPELLKEDGVDETQS